MADGDVLTGVTAPSGITLGSNVLLKTLDYSSEAQNVESDDRQGKHYGGATIKKKITLTIKGEVLEGAAATLKALENTGSATVAAPRVTNVDIGEVNDSQHSFTLVCHYFDNTQSKWKFS